MKELVIYFSRADENYFGGSIRNINKGNTEIVAEKIQKLRGATLFKVERKIPYAKNYMKCIEEAKEELHLKEAIEIKECLSSISEYDIIYIGGPIYWGTYPQPLFTQIKQLDFNNKIIKPYTTHEGSGLGTVVKDLKRICVGAIIKDGLAINGSTVNNCDKELEKWLND